MTTEGVLSLLIPVQLICFFVIWQANSLVLESIYGELQYSLLVAFCLLGAIFDRILTPDIFLLFFL